MIDPDIIKAGIPIQNKVEELYENALSAAARYYQEKDGLVGTYKPIIFSYTPERSKELDMTANEIIDKNNELLKRGNIIKSFKNYISDSDCISRPLIIDRINNTPAIWKSSEDALSKSFNDGYDLGREEQRLRDYIKYGRGKAIDRVIFNPPATIVLWNDNTKTVVKCKEGDAFDPWSGLAFCICKKIMGSENFHRQFHDYCDGFESQEKQTI